MKQLKVFHFLNVTIRLHFAIHCNCVFIQGGSFAKETCCCFLMVSAPNFFLSLHCFLKIPTNYFVELKTPAVRLKAWVYLKFIRDFVSLKNPPVLTLYVYVYVGNKLFRRFALNSLKRNGKRKQQIIYALMQFCNQDFAYIYIYKMMQYKPCKLSVVCPQSLIQPCSLCMVLIYYIILKFNANLNKISPYAYNKCKKKNVILERTIFKYLYCYGKMDPTKDK